MEGIAMVKVTDLQTFLQTLEEIKTQLKIKNEAPEGFISSSDAAEWFGGVSVETIINWAESGIITGYRIEGARKWFFKYSDLQDAVKTRDELRKYKVRL